MSNPTHFLLTGATGVVGHQLVPRLLREHPDARITLLLRGVDTDDVARRFEALRAGIRKERGRYGLRLEDVGRLEAAGGDVGLPRHGLSDATLRELRRSVTHVIHGAATTRLDDSIDVARRVNVAGTERALRFAESCPHLELFAHVSTAYVCGDREGLILEPDLWRGQSFLNTYEETKCEAELRVRRRARNLPIAVFRPSIIVGDSADGHISSFASIYSPLRHVVEGSLRHIPCHEDASLDLIPVDHVAESIVRLTADDGCVGEIYHLCAGPERRTPVRHLLEAAIRVAGRPGVALPRFAPLTNGDTLPDGTPPRLRVFFAYLNLDREFSVDRVRDHLGGSPLPEGDDFVPSLLGFCNRTDWGRSPHREEVPS